MRYHIIFGFIYLFTINDIFCQENWVNYKFENDAGISILFPGQPVKKTKQLNTLIGMLPSNNYSYKPSGKNANFLYSVNTVQYPEESFSIDSVEYNMEVISSMVHALSENLKCEIIYNNPGLVDLWPITLFRLMDQVSGQVVKGIITMRQNKLYTVTVFTMKEFSLNGDMDKFLNSFQIEN